MSTPQTSQQDISEVPNTNSVLQDRARIPQDFDHTPLKWRSLSEVMAQCNMCAIAPKNY